MVKQVDCHQAGNEDCAFMIRDENEDELVEMVQIHAERAHDMDVSRDDVHDLMHEAS